jgi:hypothetical protein
MDITTKLYLTSLTLLLAALFMENTTTTMRYKWYPAMVDWWIKVQFVATLVVIWIH